MLPQVSCPYCGRQFKHKGYLALHENSIVSCVTKQEYISWDENNSPNAELIQKHNHIIITINVGMISIDKKYCKKKKNGIKTLVISKNVVNGI